MSAPRTVQVVDVAAQAREQFGEDGYRALSPDAPEHDWRFEAPTSTGGTVIFHREATAAHVAEYLERDEAEKASGVR